MDPILPLLSGSLREIIKSMKDKYNDPIAITILKADALIEEYNRICYSLGIIGNEVFLSEINSIITDEVRMLTVRFSDQDDFTVSFLPKDKKPVYSGYGVWGRENRQSGKPGRIFQKLLKPQFKTYDWEKFTNAFKAEKCCCNDFELVEGEDIRDWYCEDTYYKCEGTLGNSCMRYENCSNYFDLYVENAKMLISKRNGKLTGRAIVWELENGTILMDRVYTCFDYLTNCFIDYAKDHKWWYRENQCLLSTGDSQYWFSPEDGYSQCTSQEFSIKLPRSYEYFPYVDSFRYLINNTITTIPPEDNNYIALDSTDGETSEVETITCANCGATFTYREEMPDGVVWSDYDDCYYCEDCCWWCEALDSYISVAEDAVEVVCKYDSQDYPQSYINDYLVTNPDGCEFPGDIIKINNKYYMVEALVWNDELKEYEIRPNSN